MPMPKPKKNEKQDDFIGRCMGDDVMKTDYTDNKQRLAVCYKQWDEEHKSMIPEIERRNFELAEFRLVENDKKAKIEGHAAMFEKLSESMFGFREKIAPGAFAQSIKKDDIRALFNHDANYVLGRNKAKTLSLKEDDLGLAIEIDPPDTQWARDLQESIKRGDISQMSFGFVVEEDEWEHFKGKESIRTLKKVQLFDVSPVTYPAYPQTSVAVRDYLNALKESEDKLDETGIASPSLERLKWNLK
jgi:HK97 family phage prohead protease